MGFRRGYKMMHEHQKASTHSVKVKGTLCGKRTWDLFHFHYLPTIRSWVSHLTPLSLISFFFNLQGNYNNENNTTCHAFGSEPGTG